jgi:hypothetical protein
MARERDGETVAAPDALVDDLITANPTTVGVRAVLDSVWANDCQACAGRWAQRRRRWLSTTWRRSRKPRCTTPGAGPRNGPLHHVLVKTETATQPGSTGLSGCGRPKTKTSFPGSSGPPIKLR